MTLVQDTPGGVFARALDLEREQRYPEALALFEQCRNERLADPADCAFHCGWCLELAGTDQDLSKRYYGVAAREAETAELRTNALFRAAWLNIQAGLLADAEGLLVDTLQVAAEHHLSNTTTLHARYWLAVCLEVDGRYLEAVELYAGVESDADDALRMEALYRQILSFGAVGDLASALKAADRYLALPTLPETEERYRQLLDLVLQEKTAIEAGLATA